jgi:hypothetical protein
MRVAGLDPIGDGMVANYARRNARRQAGEMPQAFREVVQARRVVWGIVR